MSKVHRGPISKGTLLKWLEHGTEPLRLEGNRKWLTTVIKMPKNERVTYLFEASRFQEPGIRWSDRFDFCGLFLQQTKELRLIQNNLAANVADLTAQERMETDECRNQIRDQIKQRIEREVGNDKEVLPVRELSDPWFQKQLEMYQKFSAPAEARKIFFSRISTKGAPDFRFHSDYRERDWSEDDVLRYFEAPKDFVQAAAEQYIRENPEKLLLTFLENELLQEEYERLEQDTDSGLHRMREITRAIEKYNPKTLRVTVQKCGTELTFRTEAQYMKGNRSGYSAYYIAAPDREAFYELFGRYADYTAEDIVRVTYGRNVIYEAPETQTEELSEGLTMGGMGG